MKNTITEREAAILRGNHHGHHFFAADALANEEAAYHGMVADIIDRLGLDSPRYDDWYADEEVCRETAELSSDEGYADWCDYCVNECGRIIREVLDNAEIVSKKLFVVQTATGAQADTPAAKWYAADYNPTIEQARQAMADLFAAKHDRDDRGEEFEREWERLIDRAKTAEVGEVLSFDEFAARIVEEEDE